jgi:asparaginyl-tRNA synthetase
LLQRPEEAEVCQRAKEEFLSALHELDNHLESQSFLADDVLQLIDLTLFAVLLAAAELHITDSRLVHVARWFRTISALSMTQAVLKKKSDLKLIPVVDSSIAPLALGLWDRHRIRIKELLSNGSKYFNQIVIVKGWIRTSRSAEKGALLFVELSDGSTPKTVQLVLNSSDTCGFSSVSNCGGAGASLAVVGKVVPSPAKGQVLEVHVNDAKVLGAVYGGDNGEIGGKNYPMAKKQHTLEFLREKAHLRPRSKVFSSAMRMRHAMAFATHKFFNDRGFVYVHTPLITAADCEGAGEQFVVTNLLPEHSRIQQIPKTPAGEIDYSKDFFGRRCCLTVSGQLNVETHACALSDVYTFGPTFRAEKSHTARHLAEFWMIEPEICFADLVDNMALAVRTFPALFRFYVDLSLY